MSSSPMRPGSTDANGADRPMHPAMKNVLVFIVGALFGAVCIFFFVTLHTPVAGQTLFCPPAPQAAAVTGSAPQANGNAIGAAAAPRPMMAAASMPPPAATPQAETPPVAPMQTAMPLPIPAPVPTERPSSTLLIPVAGINTSQLRDTFTEARSGGRVHDAIDIMAPRGTQVVATDDGKVAKLFYSKQGGLTVYQFDPSERFVYYYAHLDSYAPGLVEGKQLHRGDAIGVVGFSGNANEAAPHLHFAISVLGPEKHWWQATAINPYPLLTGH